MHVISVESQAPIAAGAAITNFIAPFIMVAYGWKAVANTWAAAIVVMAVVFWLSTKDEPELEARRRRAPAIYSPRSTAGSPKGSTLLT
jgi:NNP family nitrate/nitrite transporter-like MFS transporter